MTRPPTHIDLGIDAYETITIETANHLPREIGGILLGYREPGTIVVTQALVVEGQGATAHSYIRDDVRANELLQEFLEQRADDDPIGYVGEWHSHPSPSGPSTVDHASMRETAKVHSEPIALLVFAPGVHGGFFGLIARRQRFRRAAAKEAVISLPPSRFPPLGPLPDGAVRSDGPVFISYRQSDGTAQADALEDLLRSAGLVVWRDHTDLRPGTTTARLEQALTQGLSAGVLIVTPDIAHSDIVRERELPRLLQLDADPNFSLCIANTVTQAEEESKCDFGAPDRLLRLAPARTLADKKQANMRQPSGEVDIVHDLLMHRIEQRKPSIRAEGRDFSVRVQSRPASSALDADAEDLHIRLKPSDDGRLPSQRGLELLQKTLPLTSDAVYTSGAKGVRISGGAHLSVGLAIGAALPETKIGKVIVIDLEGNAWTSLAPPDDPQNTELTIEPIRIERDQAAEVQHRVAIFVTLTPHADRTAFEQLVNDSTDGFDAAEIIALRTTDRIDPREAARLSTAIAQHVKKVSATQGRAEVHLAFHGPYTMAVLVGRYLNTLRTVVYEWDGNKKDEPRYKPVLILEPGVTGGPIIDVCS